MIAVALFSFGMQAGVLSWLLSFAPLVYLGEISYSVYMTHDLVFQWAARFLSDQFFGYAPGQLWHVMAQCSLILMVIALSDMLYRCVERPCREWARRRLATRE
ncbi:hypothetical protein BKIR_c84_3574 [Candidatus Paraburkholderia kirkii UZHbot1]|uniref:Acyltransferase 3 n=1 Tax=Candidatus Paraburkholderia kirkii UZHbot1 TaxID=1055526 RepID=G4MIK8_9BURK|nr:hypothetical protein BKIR_c84_3574 [Candidatus Paraburkholderia kirkii UZHbot1]